MTTTQLKTDEGVEQRIRRVALMASTSVWTWVEEAGLEIVDGHVMLALSTIPGPVGAIDVSAQSRMPLNAVYPALHRLTGRGFAYEVRRLHALTDRGRALVADFDARYWPKASAVTGSA
jgi:hypothetical protein